MRSDLGSTADTQPHMDKLTTAEANPQNWLFSWTLDWASNSTWGTAHSWQIHGNDKRMHDHSTIIPVYSYDKYIRATVIDYKEYRTIQQDTLKLKSDTQATVQPSWRDVKLHTKCGRETWSGKHIKETYLIQLIFTILISLVTVTSAEIRPALGKHTWVTVPSLLVIWILSAVQLYLQLVAIRLGWFLVNSTWQTD